MDQSGTRTLTHQLAEDLSWLEEHCRRQLASAAQAGQLRLAAALVRNCIGPFLEGQTPSPLHVAVVGGAGAGKSTVVNFLSGTVTAEANPQAGFTRHPIAYTLANGVLNWPAHVGFLGPLQRLSQPAPASVDEDVYQVRRVAGEEVGFTLLRDFVIWDCPDMTTWAASGYVSRLLEIAGLADVIVYVASDERYNDEVPTQFLDMLLRTGKPVVVCLMKMRESDAPALLDHFLNTVLSRLTPGTVACLAIPFLTPAELADPVRLASRYRIPLLNQVAVLGASARDARRRSVQMAARFLRTHWEQLVAVARQDLLALHGWREVVRAGQIEFESRYQREYLTSEKFRRFDEALVRLIDLLDLPGVGRVVSNALWVLRTPYRLLRGLVVQAMSRPESLNIPELPVLEAALTGWLDHLHKESVRRSGTHPVWALLEKGFAGGLTEQARERFQQGFRGFQLGLADEVESTARAIYEELEKNPATLNTLRGGKLALDAAGIVGAVALGHGLIQDLVLAPVAASITHQLVEWLGSQYVENQREQARDRQRGLVRQHVSGPLAEWLAQWPSTGGSAYERLHLALRRIPPALKQLDALVQQSTA